MEAKVSRGHLEVHDEKGSYRIPVGRKSRKCLAVLDQKEGEYTRSLELDLFTGFVYYCVDNATNGGLSYYYDMSSKKVGHYFIHRYLRLARNHGFTATPQEYEVFEKLPCADWAEEVGKLPGWKEAIDNRIQRLLLPEAEPVRISMDATDKNDENTSRQAADAAQIREFLSKIEAVSFTYTHSEYNDREKVYDYLFVNSQKEQLILYRDDIVGNAFFGEDVEFERILSDAEIFWLGGLAAVCADALSDNAAASKNMSIAEEMITPDIMAGIFPGEKELALQKAVIRFKDGSSREIASDTPEKMNRARILQTAIRGLLRREIQIV